MGEEKWPANVVRSKGVIDERDSALGGIVVDGPRPIVCADCGVEVRDGIVFHLKPECFTVLYGTEEFYAERHIGVSCGCALKRGLISRPPAP